VLIYVTHTSLPVEIIAVGLPVSDDENHSQRNRVYGQNDILQLDQCLCGVLHLGCETEAIL